MMLCSDFTFAAAPHNGAHTHTRALVCPAKACFLFHAIFKFKHSARGAAGRFAFLFASLTCGEQKKLALPRVFWTDKMPRGVSRQAHPSCFFAFAAHFLLQNPAHSTMYILLQWRSWPILFKQNKRETLEIFGNTGSFIGFKLKNMLSECYLSTKRIFTKMLKPMFGNESSGMSL